MPEMTIFKLSDRLKNLRDLKRNKDNEIKVLSAEIDQVERDLIDLMVEEEMSSFKRNGSMFSLVNQEFPAAVVERKDELYRKLKVKGYESIFTVNSQTLAATVKEMMSRNEGQVPGWLDGLIKIAEKSSIRIRKG